MMANANDERSGPPEDVTGPDVSSSPPAQREQADGATTAHEREVPVTTGSEMSRETASAAPPTGTMPAPRSTEASSSRVSPRPSVAERIDRTFDHWGEQLGSSMASARRFTRDRARALAAQGDVAGAATVAHPSGAAEPSAHPAERWPESPTLQRAEDVVNRMSGRVRPLASVIGQRVQRLVARAREEAEDIWAEAESMRARGPRRGDQESLSREQEPRSPQE